MLGRAGLEEVLLDDTYDGAYGEGEAARVVAFASDKKGAFKVARFSGIARGLLESLWSGKY